MAVKINLEKAIKNLSNTWKRVGQEVIKWIRKDAIDGVFQNGSSDTYRSEQYKKYKRNDMRRYTTGEASSSTYTFDKAGDYRRKGLFFGNKKANLRKGKNITTGKRLEGYQGVTITSRETSFVNMILTGQLFKGLRVKRYDGEGVEIGYDPKDRKKIEGNRVYGREVVGLNDENIAKVKEMLIKAMGDNLKGEMEDININVVL